MSGKSISAMWQCNPHLTGLDMGFPGGTVVKKLPANTGDTKDVDLILGVGKWQPTPVLFLLGEPHGQRSLVGYSPRGSKKSEHTHRLGSTFINLCLVRIPQLERKEECDDCSGSSNKNDSVKGNRVNGFILHNKCVTVTNSLEMQVGLLTRTMISKFVLVSKDAWITHKYRN